MRMGNLRFGPTLSKLFTQLSRTLLTNRLARYTRACEGYGECRSACSEPIPSRGRCLVQRAACERCLTEAEHFRLPQFPAAPFLKYRQHLI